MTTVIPGESAVPMTDVTAPAGLLPAACREALRERLTRALPAAEGAPVAPPFLETTGWFLHELTADGVATAAGARAARTWVLLTEAAEGGWGVAGVALGRDEFTAPRASA